MTVQEAKKEIIRVIKVSTETELDITEQTNMFTDMGLSSVEVVVMLGELEDTFGIDIPASRLRRVRTVGDMCELVIQILTE
ncbi:MAG: phosphopantetheine-binding protein [Firmicutes bacterium]|nr:phosphopantetheine-binding protein [Bacillota bacterium]